MNIRTIAAIAAILVVLGAGYAVARPDNAGFWSGMMGGMMGKYGNGISHIPNGMMGTGIMGAGNGMMGRGMMGAGNGMMGRDMMGNAGGMMGDSGYCGGQANGENTTPISIEKAKESVQKYLNSTGNDDLRLTEIMEFDNHFYAEVKEKSTGVHAFELLVNRYNGAVGPEMGPNMMWNTKYGHMNPGVESNATVTGEKALEYAQEYLDKNFSGTKADEPEAFYGYYTLHVQKDGKIFGMLSINSNTGAVWYHTWHGKFERLLEVE